MFDAQTPPMHQFSDISNFPILVKELERLLNFRLVDGGFAILGGELVLVGALRKKQPIQEYISLVINYHNLGNIEFRQYSLARLGMLLLDLQAIESHDSALLKHFQRQFKRSTGNTYFGLRFEIDIAASLIIKKIAFQKGELLKGGDAANADFCLHPITLECTSVHMAKQRFSTFFYKIASAIQAKGKKSYCSRRTVLFIDITNLLQNRLMLSLPSDEDGFRATVQRAMQNSDFGAIVLSLWFFNKDTPTVRFQNLFIREDHSNVDPALSRWLTHDFGLDGSNDRIRHFKPVGCY